MYYKLLNKCINVMGPMGPRGHGPIKHVLFVSPAGFQMTFLNFGHVQNLFVSPDQFPNDIFGFWTFKKPLRLAPSRHLFLWKKYFFC